MAQEQRQFSEMLRGLNKTMQLHLLSLVLQCTCGMIVLLVKFTLFVAFSILMSAIYLVNKDYYLLRPRLPIRTECRPTVLFIVLSTTVEYVDV